MENNMYLVDGVMMCMFPAMIHDAACVLIARARSSSVTATSCKTVCTNNNMILSLIDFENDTLTEISFCAPNLNFDF